ncbi:MAG TPA: hypothetical protein VLA83_09040 [Candidatus Binatia bacterium]|nr:hypothetical protein [Candidatus Binatia bacterium]
MRLIPDQLRSKNLVPFKKRADRYNIPGMTSENEVLMDRVDADLSPEEQSYIRHYLGYADALIKGAEDRASPEPGQVSLQESAQSASATAEQSPAAETGAGLVNESKPAMKDPVRAA